MRPPPLSRLLTPLRRVLSGVLPSVLLASLLLSAPDVPRPGEDRGVLEPVATSSDCRGARSFAVAGCDPLQRSGAVTPTTTRAVGDRPDVYARGCIAKPPTFPVVSCEQALTRGRLHVALLGNSLASQWADAMAQVGRDHGWRVTTYLASSCPPTDLVVPDSTFPEPGSAKRCHDWGRAVRARMIRQGVDVVVVSASSGSAVDRSQAEQGYLDYLRPLTTAGVLVEVVRTTPHPSLTLDSEPPRCLRANIGRYLRCSDSREAWVEDDPLYAAGARLRRDRAGLIDLTDRTCTATTCPSAAGGVLLYRDGLHLTRTYVQTLRPYLDYRLTSAVRADR
ncbi:SGNH hydrolase domain-containing protein [Nocardioides plantarum]|uniref:SGNH hydrolase domain-containing protein n=1 Tax=Nocardioides plantarum TaxID=29299 RepID=A0ABV5KCL3_9ACTN|nr:SGNH hydrolase domain-containing protein [Nocardioides plantarum]